MQYPQKFWLWLSSIAACTVLGIAIVPWLFSAKTKPVDPSEQEITYICTETKEISRGPWQPTPAVNPATQRRTLMVALYCPQCAGWWPGPPPLRDRAPLLPKCPKHHIPLEREMPEQGEPP